VHRTEHSPGSATQQSGQPQSLFTIGYGARSLPEFLAELQKHQIAILVDVRTAPYSKFKPEFSKEVLEKQLAAAGIRYVFMGDTVGGQPKEPACYTDGKVDYDKVQAQPFFQAGLARLRNAAEQPRRTVLMCSEGHPEQCHRSKLIGEALAAAGIPLIHINEDGSLSSQSDVIHRLTQGQMDLFGDPSFTSRKRYAPREGSQEPNDT
jgi:uncharacterized protein (DUF488 family)